MISGLGIIVEKAESEDSFSEKDVVFLLWDILDAIRYCHDVKHVVHRYVRAQFVRPLANQPASSMF